MRTSIQIGTGNKYFSIVVLAILFLLEMFFIKLWLNNPEAWLFPVLLGFIFIFFFIRDCFLYYVHFEEGLIVMKNILKRDEKISIKRSVSAHEAGLGFISLNSSYLIFNNGKRHKVIGGIYRSYEIDAQIKQLKYKYNHA